MRFNSPAFFVFQKGGNHVSALQENKNQLVMIRIPS